MSIEKRDPPERPPDRPDARRQAALYKSVREHALAQLTDEQRHATNLYQDKRIWMPGELISLPFQKIETPRRSILVFADDKPWAGYAHECRYLFYDADTGALISEVPALFPPYLDRSARSLRLFHEGVPVRTAEAPPIVMPALGATPAPIPPGRRRALLVQGTQNPMYMNDLEFSYRTLVDTYSFDPADITILSGNGKLEDPDGNVPKWGGDQSSFRMTIGHEATRARLAEALEDLGQQVEPEDLVFIHLSGHGGPNGGTASAAASNSSSLVTFAGDGLLFGQSYTSFELEAALGNFRPHRALLVLLSQCYSGGFIPGIRTATQAKRTYVAASARFDVESAADGVWPTFSRTWMTAQNGSKPSGIMASPDPDDSNDGAIQASEAFSYALQHGDSRDKPAKTRKGTGASKITLGAALPVAYSWQAALGPPIQEFFESHGFTDRAHAAVRVALPELQKLVVKAIETSTAELRAQLTPRINSILAGAFADRHKHARAARGLREGGKKVPPGARSRRPARRARADDA